MLLFADRFRASLPCRKVISRAKISIKKTSTIFFLVNKIPNKSWLSLDFEYVDSILVLPNFKNLEILSIESQVLKKLIFVDTLPLLAIIDLNTPSLDSITTVAVPELYQLSLKANLKTLPSFICEANNLNHVSIENYTSVSEPQCWEERIENQFEYSTLEIYDHYEGELIGMKAIQPGFRVYGR